MPRWCLLAPLLLPAAASAQTATPVPSASAPTIVDINAAAKADCIAAWGDGGAGLHRCDKKKGSHIVVRKSARTLALCNRDALTAVYKTGLGFGPVGDKEKEGDGKTPEGVFYIPRRVPASQYYKAFLISYPDVADATRGVGASLIPLAMQQRIQTAQASCTEPPQYTKLGGLVEIHGNGGSSDWTWGCMAVEDKEIDVLWATINVGDTVRILP